jgi:hypothetical protein
MRIKIRATTAIRARRTRVASNVDVGAVGAAVLEPLGEIFALMGSFSRESSAPAEFATIEGLDCPQTGWEIATTATRIVSTKFRTDLTAHLL